MPGEIEGLCVTSSVDLCNEFEFCPMIHIWKVCHICLSIFTFLQYKSVCVGLLLTAAVSFFNTCLGRRGLQEDWGLLFEHDCVFTCLSCSYLFQQYPGVNQLSSSLGGLSLQHSQQPESLRPVNLTHDRNILPVSSVPAPVPNLNSDLRKLNCSPE